MPVGCGGYLDLAGHSAGQGLAGSPSDVRRL